MSVLKPGHLYRMYGMNRIRAFLFILSILSIGY
jgi:hypothetical protein